MAGILSRPPKPAPPARAMTAAGKPVDLAKARGTSSAKTKVGQDWQADAWAYRNSIGELRYVAGYLRQAVSRIPLIIAVAQADGDEPVPIDRVEDDPAITPAVAAVAKDAIARLTCGTYNYAPLMEPYAENFEIAGECWLVGYDVDDTERWEIRSNREVDVRPDGVRLVDHPGQRDGRLLTENDFACRLWQPDPEWRNLPDSPVRALLGVCEELQLTGRMLRSALRSRFASAGVLLLPDTITFASPQPSVAQDVDGEPEADPFMEALTSSMVASIQDEGDASAAVPMVLRANAEAIAAAKHITFERPVDPSLLDRQERCLSRLGGGLDVPPEIVTGLADSNHWSAWQIDDSTVRNHIAPLVARMCDGLTAGYLRPVLASEVPADVAARICVWYDLGPLTRRPDRASDAKDAWDRGALSNAALLESLGFDPETDAPTEEELGRRLALQRGAVDAPMTQALIEALLRGIPALQVDRTGGTSTADVVDGEVEEPTDDAGTPGPTTGLPASAAPQRARLHTRQSQRLTKIDTDLRERLTGAAEGAVNRAVEKATARVRSAANKDAQARAALQASGVTRALTADLGVDVSDLLAGVFAGFSEQWAEWTTAAREQALTTAAAMADLTTSSTDIAAAALAADAGVALEWLVNALTAETTATLYATSDTPDDDVVDGVDVKAGEDPTRTGRLRSVVRGAMAIAGGLSATHPGIRENGTPSEPGHRIPGFASGGHITTCLAANGVQELGYEWVYGVSRNHFQPHRDLDGVLFHDFDSTKLANPGGWPGPTFAPGDHSGCSCDTQLTYGDKLTSADVQRAGDETYDATYLNFLREMAADDIASGRTDTTAIAVVNEAERVANRRPSQQANRRP